MELGHVLVLAGVVLSAWSASGCWLLQVVCYPTYPLVGTAEFVPFHVAFGRRLGPVFVAPAVLTNLLTFVMLGVRPPQIPLSAAIGVALCSVVILGTTFASELPKHMKLDRTGKDDALLKALIRDNLPRALAW